MVTKAGEQAFGAAIECLGNFVAGSFKFSANCAEFFLQLCELFFAQRRRFLALINGFIQTAMKRTIRVKMDEFPDVGETGRDASHNVVVIDEAEVSIGVVLRNERPHVVVPNARLAKSVDSVNRQRVPQLGSRNRRERTTETMACQPDRPAIGWCNRVNRRSNSILHGDKAIQEPGVNFAIRHRRSQNIEISDPVANTSGSSKRDKHGRPGDAPTKPCVPSLSRN